MKNSMNPSNVKTLTFFCVIFLSLSVISVTYALTTPLTMEINSESAIYEVNEQGDLTIQVSGTFSGLSISECAFNLTVPDNFDIPLLSDGTPQIKLMNTGSPFSLTADDDQFESTFMISTSGTTSLPYNYTLNIIHAKGQFSMTVTPTWPDDTPSVAGGGAGITWWEEEYPYITSFYAYDADKGDSVLVKTYIYNPDNFFDWYIAGLRYKLKAYDYNNWEDWTPEKSAGIYIFPHQTKVVEHNLGPFFTTLGSKRYALNAGDYKVTQVFARGGAWDDTKNPLSEGVFEISKVTDPMIFTAIVYDSEFSTFLSVNSKSITNFIDEVQSTGLDVYNITFESYIESDSDGMEGIWGLEFRFYSYMYQWWDDNDDDSATPSITDVQNAGKTFLNTPYSWNYHNETFDHPGTDTHNQGFDILFTFTGQGKDTTEPGGTLHLRNWCRMSIDWTDDWGLGIITTLHEFYHLFEILDGWDPSVNLPEGFVMNGGEGYGLAGPAPYLGHEFPWYFRIDSQNTFLVFNSNNDRYDGFL